MNAALLTAVLALSATVETPAPQTGYRFSTGPYDVGVVDQIDINETAYWTRGPSAGGQSLYGGLVGQPARVFLEGGLSLEGVFRGSDASFVFLQQPTTNKTLLVNKTRVTYIEIAGEITRADAKRRVPSAKRIVLSHVGDSSDDMRSFADSGHAVAFQRPAGMRSIAAIQICAARYGHPTPPNEDFHVYLLDQDKKVLEHITLPYRKIDRMEPDGKLRWHTLEFPAVEVPEKFFVAFWFNAQQTKGVYLGMKKVEAVRERVRLVRETHSYTGLPDKGFRNLDDYEWMIRAVVSPASGREPTHPRVTTYEDEKAADNENAEAMPTRTWTPTIEGLTLEAQYVGVARIDGDGKIIAVILKKADGKTLNIPLHDLSTADQDFVRKLLKKPQTAQPDNRAPVELSCDNGAMTGKRSIAGSGHAVRFTADGDSPYVTSISLHGSRYGEPRPPKEDFRVWICDTDLKPIAMFRFPYSSFTRGDPAWKTFRILPIPVPREFIVCFGFNPHRTKGVYVSYDNQPSKTSLVGIPGGKSPQPFETGNWLIRCKVENCEEGGQSEGGHAPQPPTRY
jgi:hypothetical protein